ncbi:MAG: hypothetical protein Devi2KO_15010 [Devosia indica]
MDVARLGLEIDSKPVATANRELHALTGAAGQAAVAARQLAGASQMEAAGVNTATVAVRANTAAHHANNAAMKMAAMQRRNLIFQLNDIGVSLASGMNPLMVAVQQGSQIATIYEGGVVPALQATAAMAGRAAAAFWPIGLAIGAVVGVLAGLTYEINKTAEVQVGFFDVALAGWQLLSESIGALMAPVWTWFVDSMRWVWDQTAPVMKKIGNDIVSAFVAAYNVVTSGWQNLPTFMGALGKQAWNALLEGLSGDAITFTNPFTGEVNKLLSFDFTGFKAQLSPEEQGSWQSSVGSAFSQDWLGGGFGALSDRSQAIALAKTEVEALGGAAGAANNQVQALGNSLAGSAMAAQGEWGALRNTFSSFFTDIAKGLRTGGDLWQSFGSAAVTALDEIANRALTMAANGIFDAIFGSVFGGPSGDAGGVTMNLEIRSEAA